MVTFTYNGHTLTLRNPEFGNTHSIEARRVSRNSRGGDLIVFRQSYWPKTEIFDMSFIYLNENQINKIVEFLTLTLGQIISFTDYEGRNYNGIILTPSENIVTAGVKRVDFNLQFQRVE